MTPKDIAHKLAQNAQATVTYLLGSGGKMQGRECLYGDISGNAGQSLSICMNGDKAGIWADFATGDKGDLLDLWALSQNISISEAIQRAKVWLGLPEGRKTFKTKPKALHLKPLEQSKPLNHPAMFYLTQHRQLSRKAISAYRLFEPKDNVIAFPYFPAESKTLDKVAAIKYRMLEEDKYWAAKDSEKILFGWQAIPPNARTVIICEGELKALAWFDYGFPALSVPFGGGGKGKQDWIENEYEHLKRFDVIYLALDEDEPGMLASLEISQRLGVEKCAIVKHPLPDIQGAKCINACIQNHVPVQHIQHAIEQAQPRDPDELQAIREYLQETLAMFDGTMTQEGIRTPWSKINNTLLFRPGELTVIAGINGHGKSQVAGFMAAHAMKQGYKVCMASLEFKVAAWNYRLVRQITALQNPTRQFIEYVVNWMGDGRLWAYDAQGTTCWRRMLDVFKHARRRYGIDLFVVDNLSGLGISEEDLDAQKSAILGMANFARDEQCHIWLVHHVRKGADEAKRPGKMDFKGSSAITDLASTVLSVWRNKQKENDKEQAKKNNEYLSEDIKFAPDVYVECFKQRNYMGTENGEPSIPLWWDAATLHYLQHPDETPKTILPYPDNPAFKPDAYEEAAFH